MQITDSLVIVRGMHMAVLVAMRGDAVSELLLNLTEVFSANWRLHVETYYAPETSGSLTPRQWKRQIFPEKKTLPDGELCSAIFSSVFPSRYNVCSSFLFNLRESEILLLF